MIQQFQGIRGLEPAESVGAVLTVGKRDPARGVPINKNRFYVMSPSATKRKFQKMSAYARVEHPDFSSVNKAGLASVYGFLAYGSREKVFQYRLRAQKLQGEPNPKGGRPACTGDGTRASRFHSYADDGNAEYGEIDCPNELCRFRQGKPKACKPSASLYFYPNWNGRSLPSPLIKYTTGSWNNARSILGMLQSAEDMAAEAGIKPSFFLYPFSMVLAEKTSPEQESRFPVVHFSLQGNPLEVMAQQRQMIEAAGGVNEVAMLSPAREEAAAEVMDLDAAELEERPAMEVPGQQGLFMEGAEDA